MQHSTPTSTSSPAETAEHFLKFIDHLQVLDRATDLKDHLLEDLNTSLKNLKKFFKTCDPKDPHVVRLAKLLKFEINKIASQKSFNHGSNNRDEDLFVYFSKLSEEFDMINSRIERESQQGHSKASFGSENSNLFGDFYKKMGHADKKELASVISDREMFISDLDESEFQNIYDNLERTYKPKLVRMDIEENENVNEGLEALLEGFAGYLSQIRSTFETDSHIQVKKSFDLRVGNFESKWKEVVHQMILGNVRLEAKKLQPGGDLFFKNKMSFLRAVDAESLGKLVEIEMGSRQTRNFKKLVQHSLRTNKALFPFLYTCIMHMDPAPALIEECQNFVQLVEFFGSQEAPKLEVRTVHLLFMLDFITGLILRRYYLIHVLMVKAGGGTKTKREIDEEFIGFKHGIRGSKVDSSKGNVKIYQPKHDSAQKQKARVGSDEPTLIGFNELQNSELLQGSSLLKSINNSKNNYNTSEDVTALMNSSFLVNTLEALKEKKKRRKTLHDTEGGKEADQDPEARNTLGSLKKQIVGNLYQYYDSKNSKKTYPSEHYFDMSSNGGGSGGVHEIFPQGSIDDLNSPKHLKKIQTFGGSSKLNEAGNQEEGGSKVGYRSGKEISSKDHNEDKVNDISFPVKKPEDFIEFGDSDSEKEEGKSAQESEDSRNEQKERIDFSLTTKLKNEDQPSEHKVKPVDEYGNPKKSEEAPESEEEAQSEFDPNQTMPSDLNYTQSEMRVPEASNFKDLGPDKTSPSETDPDPSISHRLSNFSSNDLVSPPMSELGIPGSDQDIPKIFNQNSKFHKNERDLDLGSDLYSDGLSQNRSHPSISNTFIKPRLASKQTPLISDSLPLSQLNFQSIENTKLQNPVIQGRLEELIGSIKKAQTLQTRKPSIIHRQQFFDRLLIEEIESGYLKKNFTISEKVIPRVVNFGKNKLETVIPSLDLVGDEAQKEKEKRAKKWEPALMPQKYQDKNFPGILCSLVDNVQDTDFVSLAKMDFRRLGDLLSPLIEVSRLTPFKNSISKRSVYYKEDQWEDREMLIRNIRCPVILDCHHSYNKEFTDGRANFLTFSLGLERVLGQKLAINLFPIVDFSEGKILVIKPFSVYEVEDNSPEIQREDLLDEEIEESVWNFYDSSRRPSMQKLEGSDKLTEMKQGRETLKLSGSETYQFKKNQEDALIRQMVGKLRENYPPKEFFNTNFIKKNFILIPGKSPHPKDEPLSEMQDDLEILKEMSSFLDDFVPLNFQGQTFASQSHGSEFAINDLGSNDLQSPTKTLNNSGSDNIQKESSRNLKQHPNKQLVKSLKFAFNNPLVEEKLNDSTRHSFMNILPTIFTKFCAKRIGTYNRLFKCHPVELFKLVSRAILVKDLSSLVNTNPKDINLFPDLATKPERSQKIIEEYTIKSQNPRLLLDEYFLLRDEYQKLSSLNSNNQEVVIRRAELRDQLEIIKPFKNVLEDMNICLNLVHFMKTQLENGNCLIMLGSPKQLHYVRAIKGTNRQVEDMYIILENYEKKEFVFSFDLHKYHYVYFVFLHSSLTLEQNMIFQLGMDFFTED